MAASSAWVPRSASRPASCRRAARSAPSSSPATNTSCAAAARRGLEAGSTQESPARLARGSFTRRYSHFLGPGVLGCSSQLDQSGFALLTDVPDVASELLGWLCACAAGGVV